MVTPDEALTMLRDGNARYVANLPQHPNSSEKAQEEKQQIKGQYDQWCTDHGVPAPPEKNCQSKQGAKNEGSVLLGLVVIGIALFIVFWLIRG